MGCVLLPSILARSVPIPMDVAARNLAFAATMRRHTRPDLGTAACWNISGEGSPANPQDFRCGRHPESVRRERPVAAPDRRVRRRSRVRNRAVFHTAGLGRIGPGVSRYRFASGTRGRVGRCGEAGSFCIGGYRECRQPCSDEDQADHVVDTHEERLPACSLTLGEHPVQNACQKGTPISRVTRAGSAAAHPFPSRRTKARAPGFRPVGSGGALVRRRVHRAAASASGGARARGR